MPFAIISIIIIALLFFVLFYRSRKITAEEKGKMGEHAVATIIGETKPNVRYVLNNYIVQQNGYSAQIDHILINTFGVFVIETKNYSGLIYGNDYQKEWTQVLNFGRQKNRFYSPVKQNEVHISYIKKITPKVPIFSVIVFVKNNIEHVNSKYTIPLYRLKTLISNGTPALDAAEMESIYNLLLRHQSFSSNEEHVAHIREKVERLSNGICPRCGGNLIKKHGKYGDFYGCSNYPKCKFTHKKRVVSSSNINFPFIR